MQGSMNQPIFTGATVVLMTRWDRDTAAQLDQRYRVTGWTNIATMAIDFLANPNLARLRPLQPATHRRRRRCHARGSGAAAQAPDRAGLHRRATDCRKPWRRRTSTRPTARTKQCLGIPICDTDARVINPDTLQELGPGEVGEIVSSGPQIFQGYWKNPDATAACFIELDGKRFFRTGDLGRYDEEGYFFMVDRLKRMINASGYKVWPAEVEADALRPSRYPGGLHHRDDRSRIAARRSRRWSCSRRPAGASVSAEEIIGWCRNHMAAYKIPRVVEFADSPAQVRHRQGAVARCCRSANARTTFDQRVMDVELDMQPEDYPKIWPKQLPEEA